MAGFPKRFRNFTSVLRATGFLTRESGRLIGCKVINKTGSDITADSLVAISGFDVTSKLPKVVLADADSADLATDVYVALEKITNGVAGNVFKGGTSAATQNTNFGTVGDPVYLSTTAGAFTSTAPATGISRVQVVGYTTVKDATIGQIRWDIKPVTKISSNDTNFTQGTYTDTAVLAASATYAANIVPATLTGFSWTVAASGIYQFEVNLPTTMTTNGGLTLEFLLTTATLTSIQYQTYAATATDNATAVSTQGTTTASGTKVFDSKTAAYTLVTVKGTMVVNAGGTFAWQGCQNTSAGAGDSTIVLLGAYAKMTRVG